MRPGVAGVGGLQWGAQDSTGQLSTRGIMGSCVPRTFSGWSTSKEASPRDGDACHTLQGEQDLPTRTGLGQGLVLHVAGETLIRAASGLECWRGGERLEHRSFLPRVKTQAPVVCRGCLLLGCVSGQAGVFSGGQ